MPGARILVVEDDEVLCELILRNLQVRGHDVRIAEDAHTALEYLRTTQFDLIILDINLPDRSGWDVMRELRQLGIDVPTIVVSAVRVSQSRLAEFHPMAYLPKPFPLEAILRLVFKTSSDEPRGPAENE